METRCLVDFLICEYQNFCSLANKLGLGMNIAQCAFAVLVSSFAPKWPAFRFPFLLSEQSSLSMIWEYFSVFWAKNTSFIFMSRCWQHFFLKKNLHFWKHSTTDRAVNVSAHSSFGQSAWQESGFRSGNWKWKGKSKYVCLSLNKPIWVWSEWRTSMRNPSELCVCE